MWQVPPLVLAGPGAQAVLGVPDLIEVENLREIYITGASRVD